MIELANTSLVFVAYAAFALKRLMTYLHVLQQDDYENSRLMKWVWQHKAFDKRMSFALLVLGGAQFYIEAFFINFVIFMCFIILAYTEKDPRKNSKKKLVATARAHRIFWPSFALVCALGVPSFYYSHPWPWIFTVQMILPSILIVNLFLQPFEELIRKKYWNEARAKIQRLQPTVIGITGSFGKTSVKHILGHILRMNALTLITPGSVNTPMGITRIIREQLEEEHKFFVVEMGAYGPGSIKHLCRLTPPDIGIITAIGHAHYERFKTLERVSEAKFELAQAVMAKDGKIIIHERTLRFPYPRKLKAENPGAFIVCGEPAAIDPEKRKHVSYLSPDDVHIQKVEQRSNGIETRLTWNGTTYIVEAPLYGLHHGHNLALAFVTALQLGIESDAIHAALQSLSQIEHRLQVTQRPDQTVLIDDAFNSNPVGFSSALELLGQLKNQGRAILITPGMIELGSSHYEAHLKIGEFAGEICDVALVVNSGRIPSFVKGFKNTGGSKTLIEVDTFQEASAWVEKNKQPKDVILIENDLPDMYERIPKM
ncbi:MAG: UDP-N-acetylmuramoyl-tripeptide--D-alanyl-D-alanine ligase [Alphaproteobacteria bacterium]|nr:UDP-N-acetylmuramoyl-tripeptide--D-alanyl-D-alanine ligase [Alphaproteobacteria bacterium]